MKTLYLIPSLFALAATGVFAQTVDRFSEADINRDGMLSNEEAKHALPGVVIDDMDNDGQVSLVEAKKALPSLEISPETIEANPDAIVGAAEYQLLVRAIASDRNTNS